MRALATRLLSSMPRELPQNGQARSSHPFSANCSKICGSGGQPSQPIPTATPGVARRTASLVRNIATCFPWSSAAPPTRKATVTRSGSSRPVARLTTTLCPAMWISSPWGLALDREQRDALDAVLLGGVGCALGDEAVVVVLFEVLELEAGGFDRFAVVVALHGAADAGGPECGVASDAFGELGGGDDVGEREPAARAENPCCFCEDLCLVGGEVDDPVRDDGVGRAAL